MASTTSRDDGCELQSLILRALVKKLVAKGMLSPDDVRSLLYEAVQGQDIVIRPNVARTYQAQDAANEVVIDGD